MTLPYDISRCAGGRDFHGALRPQCRVCARQVHNKPPDCSPHWQAWIDPHSASASGDCPAFIHVNQKELIA